MIYKDPQIEIDRRIEMFFDRETDIYVDEYGENRVRWDSYNEDYESEFDWELYECLIGNEELNK